MTTDIPSGMDHALYSFAPFPARAPLAWPGGARVAIAPIVHLEHWALEPPDGAVSDPRFRDPFGDFRPDYRTHAWREYGLRIGAFRVFDLFDRYALRATLAVNSAVLERAPVLVEEALKRGWEIAGHGEIANAMISSAMPDGEIAALIDRSLSRLAAATGSRPDGWVSQDFGESASTPALLAAAGVRWIADWPNDDRPYWMATDPPLVSVPVHAELDDVQCLWHRRVPTPRYPALVAEALDVMTAEGGQCLVLGIHPWLFGMPHRIRYLDETLRLVAARAGVWRTTGGGIAGEYARQFSSGITP